MAMPPAGTDYQQLVKLLIRAASALGRLGAVLGAGLTTILDSSGVQGAADDVVSDTRQILDTTTPNQDHRVLLKVVPNAGDVGGHLKARGEAHSSHLA
jgi:hypothetical protein